MSQLEVTLLDQVRISLKESIGEVHVIYVSGDTRSCILCTNRSHLKMDENLRFGRSMIRVWSDLP